LIISGINEHREGERNRERDPIRHHGGAVQTTDRYNAYGGSRIEILT